MIINTTTQQRDNFKQTHFILKLTYSIVPIVAGLDKFTNILTYWPGYISERFSTIVPFGPQNFMYVVGVIEMVAGFLLLAKPRIGAYVVMSWLVLIARVLIIGGRNFDVAVRDIVIAIGVFAFSRDIEEK